VARFTIGHTMPTLRTCHVCGRITEDEYCDRHKPTHTGRSPKRDSSKQRTFRRLVLARDNHRCRTCGRKTDDLRACHVIPLAAFLDPSKAYDLKNGITRCRDCDRDTDPFAT
jgi:5-methylcytosine-specific restriction endonuclease McrA